ncbi:hypothetical protein BB561_003894 [Smittium simulii]|uniref:Uncharacterized protein n=1 Tax=Smittium simulii TaxID=133385 RepID=A0A2T9YJ28_9FUNG|nr:hypothetical protein BB561_003894 [Smittium simulii]
MEVIKDNFPLILPKFEKQLQECSIISLDLELTGLWENELTKTFKFDDFELRYKKLKKIAEKFQIIQVGICLFQEIGVPELDLPSKPHSNSEKSLSEQKFGFNPENTQLDTQANKSENSANDSAWYHDYSLELENSYAKHNGDSYYEARPYNFFVYPSLKSGLYKLEKVFSLNNSTIDFLAENGFDFNKWIYQGISYINLSEINHLEKDKMDMATQSITINVSRDSVDFYTSVKRKLDSLKLDDFGKSITISTKNNYQMRIVHQEARLIPTLCSEGNLRGVTVTKVTSENKNILINDKIKYISQKTEASKGFSKIIQLLLESKKPIIAHNCFADFVFIYSNFYGQLPNTLAEFKIKLHELFPIIYDTKFFVETKNALEKKTSSSVISCVNESITDINHNLPVIKLNSRFNNYSTEKLHEAGYDAFISGRVMLKLNPQITKQPLNKFANKLYMYKSKIPFVDLTGPDIENTKSAAIFLESTEGDIDYSELEKFLKDFFQNSEMFIFRISRSSCLIHSEISDIDEVYSVISTINSNTCHNWVSKPYDETIL